MKKLRIVSYSEEPFKDRYQAGRLLAQELEALRNQNAIVLGIPRGGLVIAWEIASRLAADVDVVLSRKLGAPGNSELAIGAVTEEGKLFLNEGLIGRFGYQASYIQEEKEQKLKVIKQRVGQYRAVLAKVPLKDRIVIVTDDGVATGSTMQAALWAVGQEKPQRLIAALPVGPEDTLKELSNDADELICLRVPAFFGAIGQFYLDFTQVEDSEVLAILQKEAERKSLGGK